MPSPVSLPDVPWQTINLSTKIESVKKTVTNEKRIPSDRNDPQLRKACAELESLFIAYLLKEMRTTIPKSDFINGGRAEEIYTSMLDSEMARDLSAKGGIGLSSILLDQLGRRQESVKNQIGESKLKRVKN
jgi:flagellar protein FlgJ